MAVNTRKLDSLAGRWRDEAERFRQLGQEAAARMSEAHADELDRAARAWADEALTLDDAAAESGYSVSRLQHLVADGDLPNAGEKGSPAIRRADLPRRPGHVRPRRDDGAPDLAGAAAVRRLTGDGR